MIFFVGLHQESDAHRFDRCMISAARLRRRKSGFVPSKVGWILDSGAFSELSLFGDYRSSVEEYAREAVRWQRVGKLEAIVAQDFMCEAVILRKTGLTVEEHQRRTIERFDQLVACPGLTSPIMPVLQGWTPEDYRRHVRAYSWRLARGAWVGVGSVCKRNARPGDVLAILEGILDLRPDLRIHAFGLKITALEVDAIRRIVFSSDSQAWSFAARWEGRDAHSWREAMAYSDRVDALDRTPAAIVRDPFWLQLGMRFDG